MSSPQSIIPDFESSNIMPMPAIHAQADQPVAIVLPPGHRGKVFVPMNFYKCVHQAVALADVAAFERYLERQVVTPETLAIYVQPKERSILAMLDHCQDASKAGTLLNSATLALNYSADFAPLAAVLGENLSQTKFVEFLEEHSYLFLEAAALGQMAANFSAIEITTFNKSVNLDNGTSSLVYATAEQAENTTKVPNTITTKLAIFEGQPDVDLTLRLRYVKEKGVLFFKLICPGLTKIIEDEIVKLEARLLLWLSELASHRDDHGNAEARDWSKAMLVRGTPNFQASFTPAKVVDVEGGPIPVRFGGSVPK